MMEPALGPSDPGDRALQDTDAVVLNPLSGEEVRRKAAIGAVFVSGGSLALRVLGLAANVVFARLLTPDDFGVIAFGLTLTAAGAFVADAGLGAGLVRQPDDVRRSDLQGLLAFQLVASLLIAALVAVVGTLTDHGAVIAVMALSLPAAVLKTPGAILQERHLAYRTLTAIELIQHSSYYVWATVSVALGAGVWGLASAVVVRAVAGAMAMLVFTPEGRMSPHWNWPRVRSQMGFGAGFQGVGLVGMLRGLAFNAGIASIAGISTLGLWSFAFGLLQAPFIVLQGLYRISFPAMARLQAAGEEPGPMLQRMMSVIGITAGILIAGLVGTAPALIPSVFGSRWEAAIGVLPFAGLGFAFSGPISVASTGYLFAKGKSTTVLTAVALSALVRLAVGLGLLALIGVDGLGIGILAAAAAEAAALAAGVRRLTKVRFARALLPCNCAVILSAAAGWATATTVGKTVFSAVVSGAVVLVVYVLCLLLLDREGMRLSWARLSGLLRHHD